MKKETSNVENATSETILIKILRAKRVKACLIRLNHSQNHFI